MTHPSDPSLFLEALDEFAIASCTFEINLNAKNLNTAWPFALDQSRPSSDAEPSDDDGDLGGGDGDGGLDETVADGSGGGGDVDFDDASSVATVTDGEGES